MAVTLTLIGKTPGQTQFGLDTFTEHYKCDATADIVLTDGGVPAMGSAHPDYATMFVTARYCSETGESASALDLTYMGTLSGSLPAQKTDSSFAVQSATSSKGSLGTLTSPATLQYYAPQQTLTYISYTSEGTTTAPEPSASPVVITLTVGDTSISPGSGGVPEFVDAFFTQQILNTIESTEIVAGEYWLNVARTIKTYAPFIFDVTPGAYLTLYSPGTGYAASDTLTVSSGGESATIVVDSVGAIWGTGNGILSYHVTATDFTVAHNALMASGGSGSGAGFNVMIIP